jgi:hypothetical protein
VPELVVLAIRSSSQGLFSRRLGLAASRAAGQRWVSWALAA